MYKRFYGSTNETFFVFPLFSTGIRIGYGLMLLCIAAASALTYAERQRVPVLGIVLGCFSLFVLCYVDRWRFNATTATAEYTVGLVFFTVTEQYPFADVEKTETERFTKGFLKTPFVKCLLWLRTGEKKTVAVFPERKKKLARQWETLTTLLDRENERAAGQADGGN